MTDVLVTEGHAEKLFRLGLTHLVLVNTHTQSHEASQRRIHFFELFKRRRKGFEFTHDHFLHI